MIVSSVFSVCIKNRKNLQSNTDNDGSQKKIVAWKYTTLFVQREELNFYGEFFVSTPPVRKTLPYISEWLVL